MYLMGPRSQSYNTLIAMQTGPKVDSYLCHHTGLSEAQKSEGSHEICLPFHTGRTQLCP